MIPPEVEKEFGESLDKYMEGWAADLKKHVEEFDAVEKGGPGSGRYPAGSGAKWSHEGGDTAKTLTEMMRPKEGKVSDANFKSLAAKIPTKYSKDPAEAGRERESKKLYLGGAYQAVNDYLRRGEKEVNPRYLDEVKGAVADMDRLIGRSSLPEEATTYRGANLTAAQLGKLKEGTEFSDKGYGSTSVSAATAMGFTNTRWSEPVLFVNSIPKGSQAMTGDFGEHEVILPRGARFTVTKVEKPDYKTHMPPGVGDKKVTVIHVKVKT